MNSDSTFLRVVLPLAWLTFVFYSAYQYTFPPYTPRTEAFSDLQPENFSQDPDSTPKELAIAISVPKGPLGERVVANRDEASKAVTIEQGYKIQQDGSVWRQVLYVQKDFEAIEYQAGSLYELRDVERGAARYAAFIDALGELHENVSELYTYWLIDEWKIAYPESHFPWLVESDLRLEKVWGLRGTTAESRAKFREAARAARETLVRAHELEPEDAQPLIMLMAVARALEQPRETMESYFEKAVALSPQRYDTWGAKLTFLMPVWGGSWEAMREFMTRAEAAGEEYPLVAFTVVAGLKEMQERKVPGIDLSAPEQWEEVSRIYGAMLEAFPNDMDILMDYAHDAYRFAPDPNEAAAVFDRIGERFQARGPWKNVKEYNTARANTYLKCARTRNAAESDEFVEKAYRLAPGNAQALYLYGLLSLSKNRRSEAEQTLLRCLEVKSGYVPAMTALADMYLHQARYDEAESMALGALDEPSARALREEAQGYLNDARRREHTHEEAPAPVE